MKVENVLCALEPKTEAFVKPDRRDIRRLRADDHRTRGIAMLRGKAYHLPSNSLSLKLLINRDQVDDQLTTRRA